MVKRGAGPEVGSFLVPRARVLVGPGASRAPRTVARPEGRSTHPRLRSSGAPRRRRPDREAIMDILYKRCAGLDIHRDTIVACVRLAEAGGGVRLVETFATTTADLERLSAWLTGHSVTCVAMEATGVYWKPVWAVLAGGFELVLANAMHVKAVPGRKTDVNDAMWLADLLAHGLIRPSFVPSLSEQALRDLTRARKQLTREKASHVQRIDKTLQAANIKLGSVLSNIMGQSGRALLEALAAGETDPERLARPVRPKIRASHAQVVEAVRGRLAAHQRLLLRLYLAQVDALDAATATIDHELGERLEPVQETVQRLTTMPGVSPIGAKIVLDPARGGLILGGDARRSICSDGSICRDLGATSGRSRP